MEKSRNNKGITLITLVITIIVLLILAVVTISTIKGGDGLLARAEDFKTNANSIVEDEEEKKDILLNDVLGEMGKPNSGEETTTPDSGSGEEVTPPDSGSEEEITPDSGSGEETTTPDSSSTKTINPLIKFRRDENKIKLGNQELSYSDFIRYQKTFSNNGEIYVDVSNGLKKRSNR